jgi:tRNA-uridine 2-sulfurtransferase
LRVVVAMSGGVDSSVAAGIMVEAGHEVIGITMKLRDAEPDERTGSAGSCCSPSDLMDARRVCDDLGIAHYVLDYREVFRTRVIEPFAEDYLKGLTPNPCVQCNDHVKFAPLMERSQELGADYLVTGHYARIVQSPEDHYYLRRAQDLSKDQSYFLFGLGQTELSKLLFPLGGLDKETVRAKAKSLGLANWDKADSEDICFVPGGDYKKVVERIVGPERLPGAGELVDSDGGALGEHDGIHRYTIGQRRGLGLTAGERLYVTAIDQASNQVVVGKREALLSGGLQARGCRWSTGMVPQGPVNCTVRIRFRHRGVTGEVVPVGDRALVRFDTPQLSVAPGQAVVFYQNDCVVGGGWIERATPNLETPPHSEQANG